MLIYKSDTELEFDNTPEQLKRDIQNKQVQIYNAFHEYREGWESPIIYLIGRGRNYGKFIVPIKSFKPYTYFYNDGGDYKTYLGESVEKTIFDTVPMKVGLIRQKYERAIRTDIPCEADIFFYRRFLIDMYDYFKSSKANVRGIGS